VLNLSFKKMPSAKTQIEEIIAIQETEFSVSNIVLEDCLKIDEAGDF